MEKLNFTADPMFVINRGLEVIHERSENQKNIAINNVLYYLKSNEIQKLVDLYLESISFEGEELNVDVEFIEKLYVYFVSLTQYDQKLHKIKQAQWIFDSSNNIYYGHDFAEHAKMLYTILKKEHGFKTIDISNNGIEKYINEFFTFGMVNDQVSMIKDVAKEIIKGRSSHKYYIMERYEYSKLKLDQTKETKNILGGNNNE